MSYKQPLVSIILPTYNRGHVIARAIQSVLNQTYSNFELIIIDDGSCDDTESVVKSFNDSRIKYFRQNKNYGASIVRNIGIKTARGDYIAFQDSDDLWLPHKLERQVKSFETSPPEVGVAYCEWFCARDKRIYQHRYFKKRAREGNIHKEIDNYDFFIAMPTVIIRRSCLEKVGLFDETFQTQQDFELFLRLSHFFHFNYIDMPLVIVSRPWENQIDKRTKIIIKTNFLLLEKHPNLKEKKAFVSNHYYLMGKHFFFKKNEQQQWQKYFRYSIKSNPFDLFSIKLFFLYFSGYVFNGNRLVWLYKQLAKKFTNPLILWLLRG
ncbi:MAG: glycosyltransferase family 2 protein [Candidatus Hodarchaeota archaeon]